MPSILWIIYLITIHKTAVQDCFTALGFLLTKTSGIHQVLSSKVRGREVSHPRSMDSLGVIQPNYLMLPYSLTFTVTEGRASMAPETTTSPFNILPTSST